MCPYHHIRKNNRQIARSQYREEIADAGEVMVNSMSDLINLDYALAQAMQIYGRASIRGATPAAELSRERSARPFSIPWP